jgi:hypothetical protein
MIRDTLLHQKRERWTPSCLRLCLRRGAARILARYRMWVPYLLSHLGPQRSETSLRADTILIGGDNESARLVVPADEEHAHIGRCKNRPFLTHLSGPSLHWVRIRTQIYIS